MAKNNNKAIRLWGLLSVLLFGSFIVLQLPAAWLLAKFLPSNQTIDNISGNVWSGRADWHAGSMQGIISWTFRPIDLLRLRASSDIDVRTGDTHLTGKIGYGIGKSIYFSNMSGQVVGNNLSMFSALRWPTAPIQVKDVSFKFNKDNGFSNVDGDLNWTGGIIEYTQPDRVERLNMPPLQGQLTGQNGKLQMAFKNNQQERMLDVGITPNLMLDVQLTQRLLLNMPSYQGRAGLDSYVISTRQPLLPTGAL